MVDNDYFQTLGGHFYNYTPTVGETWRIQNFRDRGRFRISPKASLEFPLLIRQGLSLSG